MQKSLGISVCLLVSSLVFGVVINAQAYSTKVTVQSGSQTSAPVGGTATIKLRLKNTKAVYYPHVVVEAYLFNKGRQLQFTDKKSPAFGQLSKDGYEVVWGWDNNVPLKPNGTFDFSVTAQVTSGKPGDVIPINIIVYEWGMGDDGEEGSLGKLDDEYVYLKVAASPKTSATPTPTPLPTPTVKITTKNFALTGPDGLEMNGDDQTIYWSASDAVKKAYPNVKLELCSGKPFQGCMVLSGSTPNDGEQSVNLAPVPRAGKWYLHMIGRDTKNAIQAKVSAERIVVLHR